MTETDSRSTIRRHRSAQEIHPRTGALPGVTREELLAHDIGPEVHAQLALAMLIKTSTIEVLP